MTPITKQTGSSITNKNSSDFITPQHQQTYNSESNSYNSNGKNQKLKNRSQLFKFKLQNK